MIRTSRFPSEWQNAVESLQANGRHLFDATASQINPSDFGRTLQTHWRRCCWPAVVFGAVAIIYLQVRSPKWEASQTLAIRNEAVNNADGAGRFRELEQLKLTQETILELAKSQGVLTAALTEVGPPGGGTRLDWPRRSDVFELRRQITVSPPKGAEFGKTEIFHLSITDRDRQRAERLVSAVAQHLQKGLQELRRAKAQSMIDELGRSAELAEEDLQRSVQRLSQLERDIGSDLGELRMLDMHATADSDLRRKLITIEAELRETQTTQQLHRELQNLLLSARQDPTQLLATPNRLLESQPALRRLKEGLIDTQLKTSQLLGSMRADHPQVVASHASESEIRRQLHAELESATRGVEVESRLAASRLSMLQAEQSATASRLDKVARLRAAYSCLSDATKHRTTLVETAHRDLSEARASQAGAITASLITPVDGPETGDQPVGPDDATILFAAIVAGLLAGMSLVFLTVPNSQAVSQARIPEEASKPLARPRSDRVLSLNEALAKVAVL